MSAVRARATSVVLSCAAIAALAVSLMTSAWWVGPVAGVRSVVSLGLLSASRCFTIGEKTCTQRSLIDFSETFGMLGIVTFATCGLVALMMLTLAYMGWRMNVAQRSVGKFTVPVVASAAACAVAFILSKPSAAIQPVSYGLVLGFVGLGMALVRSISAIGSADADGNLVGHDRVSTAKVMPFEAGPVESALAQPPAPRSSPPVSISPPERLSPMAIRPPANLPPVAVHNVQNAGPPRVPRTSRASLAPAVVAPDQLPPESFSSSSVPEPENLPATSLYNVRAGLSQNSRTARASLTGLPPAESPELVPPERLPAAASIPDSLPSKSVYTAQPAQAAGPPQVPRASRESLPSLPLAAAAPLPGVVIPSLPSIHGAPSKLPSPVAPVNPLPASPNFATVTEPFASPISPVVPTVPAVAYIPGAPAIATFATGPAPQPSLVRSISGQSRPTVASAPPALDPQKTIIPLPALPSAPNQEPVIRSRPDITKPPIRRDQIRAVVPSVVIEPSAVASKPAPGGSIQGASTNLVNADNADMQGGSAPPDTGICKANQ